jgi:hypothetical protein
MKQSFFKVFPLIGSTVLATILLTGCSTGSEDNLVSPQQPHKKINRTFKDWTWNVDAQIHIDGNGLDLTTFYFDNIPDNIKHYQLFIDTIPNKGYNGEDGWEVYGADYLVEDDIVFKSLSDTEWKWELKGFINLVDNKKDGNERAISILDSKLLESYIKSDKVNIYIEAYDENWTGGYCTIPLPDIAVDNQTDKLVDTVRQALEAKNKIKTFPEISLSPDHNTAVVHENYKGHDYIYVYDITDPTNPIYQHAISHKEFNMPHTGIKNLKVFDNFRVSYVLYEKNHRRNTSLKLLAKPTGVEYDVLANYKVDKVLTKSYTKNSQPDTRTILREKMKTLHGDSLSYFRFDYSPDRKYGIVTTSLGTSQIRTVDVYDLSDRANPVKMHQLFEISDDTYILPHFTNYVIVSDVHVSYDFSNNTILKYRIVDTDNKIYIVEIDYLTKQIISKKPTDK